MKILKTHKCFEGRTEFCAHESKNTKTTMNFSTFIPEGEARGCVIWLSGLTCTEENFITKAGAQKYLAENKLMLVAPDTSPRGLDLPGEHESYDFGSGAGFYVDSTVAPYNENYNMYSYIVKELTELIKSEYKIDKFSIMGHSMGGHGALVMALREKDLFKSVSAFSPIVNPTAVPWGEKAFKGYLGDDKEAWKKYDACELIKNKNTRSDTILIDQGDADEFLENQLRPENFEKACKEGGQELRLNMRQGYDHSYYFIATFIEDHIKHHANYLK